MATATTLPPSASRTDRRQDRQRATRALFEQLAHEKRAAVRHRLRDEVVALNLEYARAMAARYRGRGIDADDLLQVACLGLVKAARAFSLDVGDSFLAYARPTIEGELKRHFRDCAWAIRPPRRLQELHAHSRRAEAGLAQTLGHQASTSELAEHVGAPETEMREAASLGSCFSCLSLSTPREPDGACLADTLADTSDAYERVRRHQVLAPALASLSNKEQRVLQLRFVEGLSQAEIGRRIGTSQMQVSRLLVRILETLRSELDPDAFREPA
jgi:RNA polymerase sigma-B factor